MGKDPFSPKAISNRMKAKGLQKLKWYCQMCEKQCRDENGFKCHCISESHQRQMKLFSDTPSKFIHHYSSQFLHDFLQTLSVRFGTKRVLANTVYQEYIRDKSHIHMNSTHWNSLTEFCYSLTKRGIVEIEDTQRGLFITWIDQSPAAIARRQAKERKELQDLEDQQRSTMQLQLQIERAKSMAKDNNNIIDNFISNDIQIDKDTLTDKKISLSVKKKQDTTIPVKSIFQEHYTEDVTSDQTEDIMWLHKDLLVRILSSQLDNGRYFDRIGHIVQVIEDYIADVQIEFKGHQVIIRVDQDDLAPVHPVVLGQNLVYCIYGPYSGKIATIQSWEGPDHVKLKFIDLNNDAAYSPVSFLCQIKNSS